MKKSFIGTLSVIAVTSVAITSCKKMNQQPGSSSGKKQTENTTKSYVHISGIGSNQGYPTNGTTDYGRYGTTYALGQLSVTNLSFGGLATSADPNGVKGYAAVKGYTYGNQGYNIFAYKGLDNVTWLNINGSDYPLLKTDNSDIYNYNIEEIEVDPLNTNYVYMLCRESNGMRIYRFDVNTGSTTLLMYEYAPGLTKTDVFQNVSGNGYKSGSIAFVKGTAADPNAYRLVMTHESTVYSAQGICTNHFIISGNLVKPAGNDPLNGNQPYNKTYSTATSGIPGAQTGKLNTTFGDGVFYIARDGGNLYSLNLNTSNTAATLIATSAQFNNKYDFGYYDSYND